MTKIENLILMKVLSVFKIQRILTPEQVEQIQLDRIVDEIVKESNEDEDINEYLVDEGFPNNCAKLAFDTYVRLPYRLRTLIGLSELGMSVGDSSMQT